MLRQASSRIIWLHSGLSHFRLKHAEDDIAHFERKGQSTSHVERIGTIFMNVLTEGRIRGRISRLGRLSATEDRTGEVRIDVQPTHPDQPRGCSLINDNYCVDKLQGRLLAGSKQATETLNIQTPLSQVVDFSVVTSVHFAKGHSQ